jgi:hypothetical protein
MPLNRKVRIHVLESLSSFKIDLFTYKIYFILCFLVKTHNFVLIYTKFGS